MEKTYRLKELTLKGFKSIGEINSIQFGDINVLIGDTGAGKSNLLSFFKLLEALAHESLQFYIGKQGYADAILHYGAEHTQRVQANLRFSTEENEHILYSFFLAPTNRGQMAFESEEMAVYKRNNPTPHLLLPDFFGMGHAESKLHCGARNPLISPFLSLLKGIKFYHFNDTSEGSAIRMPAMIQDNRMLHSDGSNLPAVLYRMQMQEDSRYRYSLVLKTMRAFMPQFKDFVLKPIAENPNMIRLEWQDKYHDQVFGVHQISDAFLRLLALACLFLQPPELLPSFIVIDEPDLGLDQIGLEIFRNLLELAEGDSQVLIATQSKALLNLLNPEDFIRVESHEGKSSFKRFSEKEIAELLIEMIV